MEPDNRTKVIENYYKAINALMEIGIINDLPCDLMTITITASVATTKIIQYLNEHKEV